MSEEDGGDFVTDERYRWVDLDQTDKPVYYDKLKRPICEPCAQGYHEHHRQIVGWGENPTFGEADCKNLISTGGPKGQCCCYKQPTGDFPHEGDIPTPFQKVDCEGCREIVKIAPVKYYRKPPIFCLFCNLGWEINEGGGGWAPTGKISWLKKLNGMIDLDLLP